MAEKEPIGPSSEFLMHIAGRFSAGLGFRTALAFEAADRRYQWLNRLIAVGVDRRTPDGMATDAFAIR
jgi:Protein of unknown function (DUF3237)